MSQIRMWKVVHPEKKSKSEVFATQNPTFPQKKYSVYRRKIKKNMIFGFIGYVLSVYSTYSIYAALLVSSCVLLYQLVFDFASHLTLGALLMMMILCTVILVLKVSDRVTLVNRRVANLETELHVTDAKLRGALIR